MNDYVCKLVANNFITLHRLEFNSHVSQLRASGTHKPNLKFCSPRKGELLRSPRWGEGFWNDLDVAEYIN